MNSATGGQGPAETNSRFLEGHTIYLRVPQEEDITRGPWHTWYNDQRTTRINRHGVFPVTIEQELEYVRRAASSRDTIILAICVKESGRLIGNIALNSIDLLNRRAEQSITIGEAEPRAPTAGLEAIGLLTNHAFTRLNLHRVYSGVHEEHEAWLRAMGVFGFQPEGRLREEYCRNGRFYDTIPFAVLENEFMESKAARGGHVLFEDLSSLVRAVAALSR